MDKKQFSRDYLITKTINCFGLMTLLGILALNNQVGFSIAIFILLVLYIL